METFEAITNTEKNLYSRKNSYSKEHFINNIKSIEETLTEYIFRLDEISDNLDSVTLEFIVDFKKTYEDWLSHLNNENNLRRNNNHPFYKYMKQKSRSFLKKLEAVNEKICLIPCTDNDIHKNYQERIFDMPIEQGKATKTSSNDEITLTTLFEEVKELRSQNNKMMEILCNLFQSTEQERKIQEYDVLKSSSQAIAKEFAAIRKSKNISQRKVAEHMDVKPSQISEFEKGTKNPTWSTIQRYARAIGVNPKISF